MLIVPRQSRSIASFNHAGNDEPDPVLPDEPDPVLPDVLDPVPPAIPDPGMKYACATA
jgi:hypothetical protein